MSLTFSVIIPAFNREETIGETLASVERQRFRDFECIVVDDGSQDKTCAIVVSHRSVALIREGNAGPGAARNRGVQAASGNYLAFLDSDDLWFPWTLQVYAEAISRFGNPAFVTGRHYCFRDAAELSKVRGGLAECQVFSDYFAAADRWRWFGASSFVIRRDAFRAVGEFATGYINGEDAELALRLGTAEGFVHIANPPMFGYRVHAGNVTKDRRKSLAGLQLLLAGERDGRFPGGPERASERAAIISRHVRPMALECAREGECRAALSLYRAVCSEARVRRRWAFLAGLPVLCLWGLCRRIVNALFSAIGKC